MDEGRLWGWKKAEEWMRNRKGWESRKGRAGERMRRGGM